jgi:tripartite-type tricarboxylate transporter receptor subunit TctC
MKTEVLRRKYPRRLHPLGPVVGIFAFLLLVSLTILVPPVNGAAKDWPTKPITIIVPWAAGASTDLTPRTLAPKMSKILGVPINVVNKPGGSGIIGTLEAVKALKIK